MSTQFQWNFETLTGFNVKYTLPGPWYVTGPGDRVSCNVTASPTSASYFSVYSNQRVGSNDLASKSSIKFDFYHDGSLSNFSELAIYGCRDVLVSSTSASNLFSVYVRDDDATYANYPDRTTVNLLTLQSTDAIKINTGYNSADLSEISSLAGIYSLSISWSSDSIRVSIKDPTSEEIFSKLLQIQDPSNTAIFDDYIGSWLVFNFSGNWGSKYITGISGYYDLTEQEQLAYHDSGSLTSAEVFAPVVYEEIEYQEKLQSTDYAIDISENVISEGWVYDSRAIKQSVKNLVLTSFRSRFFEEQVGTSIQSVFFKQVNQDNGRFILNEILTQLNKYEDRITTIPNKCRIILDPTRNLMRLVVPFYINETGVVETLDEFVSFG